MADSYQEFHYRLAISGSDDRRGRVEKDKDAALLYARERSLRIPNNHRLTALEFALLDRSAQEQLSPFLGPIEVPVTHAGQEFLAVCHGLPELTGENPRLTVEGILHYARLPGGHVRVFSAADFNELKGSDLYSGGRVGPYIIMLPTGQIPIIHLHERMEWPREELSRDAYVCARIGARDVAKLFFEDGLSVGRTSFTVESSLPYFAFAKRMGFVVPAVGAVVDVKADSLLRITNPFQRPTPGDPDLKIAWIADYTLAKGRPGRSTTSYLSDVVSSVLDAPQVFVSWWSEFFRNRLAPVAQPIAPVAPPSVEQPAAPTLEGVRFKGSIDDVFRALDQLTCGYCAEPLRTQPKEEWFEYTNRAVMIVHAACEKEMPARGKRLHVTYQKALKVAEACKKKGVTVSPLEFTANLGKLDDLLKGK